jgi:hypothetical protein
MSLMECSGIIKFLDDYYGASLIAGNECAFYEFTPKNAKDIFNKYLALTENQELFSIKTTLQKTNFLLATAISPRTTYSCGGNHPLYGDEDIMWHDQMNAAKLEKHSGESVLDFLQRKRTYPSDAETRADEEAVRARRTENLKTLLLIAPSVTIPDQVWMLSASQQIQKDASDPSSYVEEYTRRWKAYIKFLASIRPLIDQGAIRIVSARRMSLQARYNESSFTPDPDLYHALSMKFDPSSKECLVINYIIKYYKSLATYGSSAFYERPEHIKVHQ